MDISSPQFRESIIAMDGEIVRPRIRTHAQVDALTGKATTLVFKDNALNEYWMPDGFRTSLGTYLKIYEVAFSAWNCDTTATFGVNHALAGNAIIVGIFGYVYDNAGANREILSMSDLTCSNMDLAMGGMTGSTIYLCRRTGGVLDAAGYNAAYGKLFVIHIPSP